MPPPEAGDRPVVVIGAGPAGLATAAALAGRGVAVRHLDRTGRPGGAYAAMDPDLVMTSPAHLTGLAGLAAPAPARGDYFTAAEYHAYLRAYAEHHRLAPESAMVTAVTPATGGPRVTLAGGATIDAAAVVIATGMFDHPVRPAVPGLPDDGPAGPDRPAVLHAAAWRGAQPVRGQRVLIVGGASSAVELAEACAPVAAQVVVAARDGRVHVARARVAGRDPAAVLLPLLARAPCWTTPGLCHGTTTVPGVDRGFGRLRAAGRVEVRHQPVAVDGRRVRFADGAVLDVDVIVLATGYRHAAPVAPADLARTRSGAPRCRDGRSVSHPDLWFVGTPCARRPASQYLYGMARDAPAVAAAIAALGRVPERGCGR